MEVGMNVLGLGLAVGLAVVHLFPGRSRWVAKLPRRLWSSFAGGISIAYIFLDIFPELTRAQSEIEESGNGLVLYFDHHVYLLSLLGLLLFYGLERMVLRSRYYNHKMTGETSTELGIFGLHIAFFAAYNAVLGYLFRESAVHGIADCIILFFALGLHFLVNDIGLRSHHQNAYDRVGRWILSGSILVGWGIGQLGHFNEAAIAAIWALIAGSIIFNVLKEELPNDSESHFGLFAVGVFVYAVILSF